ncbi:MAG: DNA-processing protein DprA [Lachnospiraceae bacterium]|nr:DNA-processing protein DprA [Lachnospiraceae bacterium]
MEKRLYQLYLAELAYAMPGQVRILLHDLGSAEEIWKLTEREISRIDYLKAEQKAEMTAAKQRGLPAYKLEEAVKKGIEMVCMEDAAYPERLRHIAAPPYMLFYKGRLPEETVRHVAVIGARRCSDYGRRAAAYFGRELAKAGVPVISGLAVGIDGLSQAACVAEGGVSYGVLGSGVDIIYPAGNRELYHAVQEKGGIISEYLPGTVAASWHFPQRNRLISGFADLVLVVEARERSGTFITVDFALEQGREVFAVPGRVGDNLSLGCNRLIRDGAGIATCAEDILLELKRQEGSRTCEAVLAAENHGKKQPKAKVQDGLTTGREQAEKWTEGIRPQVRQVLLDAPASAEELYQKTMSGNGNIQELLAEMMLLEIEGLVVCKGGMYELY